MKIIDTKRFVDEVLENLSKLYYLPGTDYNNITASVKDILEPGYNEFKMLNELFNINKVLEVRLSEIKEPKGLKVLKEVNKRIYLVLDDSSYDNKVYQVLAYYYVSTKDGDIEHKITINDYLCKTEMQFAMYIATTLAEIIKD